MQPGDILYIPARTYHRAPKAKRLSLSIPLQHLCSAQPVDRNYYALPVNVHPYLYKGNYDFKFDTIKDRVDEYVNYARENPMDETPEMDGGVTTVA